MSEQVDSEQHGQYAEPPRPTLALRVGVTGHRSDRLGPGGAERIERQVSDILDLLTSAAAKVHHRYRDCLLYTSPSPRDLSTSRMPSSA